MGTPQTSVERDVRSTITLYSDFGTVGPAPETEQDAGTAMKAAARAPEAQPTPEGAQAKPQDQDRRPVPRPWGAPHWALREQEADRREKLVRNAKEMIEKLLGTLHQGVIDGDLTPADLEDLHRLQLWYGRLMAELDRIRIAKSD